MIKVSLDILHAIPSAGDSDFLGDSVVLTFTPGMSRACFNVDIVDDDLYEEPEDFIARISTTDRQVSVSPMATTVTILDNDGKNRLLHRYMW